MRLSSQIEEMFETDCNKMPYKPYWVVYPGAIELDCFTVFEKHKNAGISKEWLFTIKKFQDN